MQNTAQYKVALPVKTRMVPAIMDSMNLYHSSLIEPKAVDLCTMYVYLKAGPPPAGHRPMAESPPRQQVVGAEYQVTGTRYLIVAACKLVPGTWTRYQVLRTKNR